MELSNDEGIEVSAKTQKISDENKDYISELPDSILVHTLSFLPIGDAIKTVLLRRFGNLWRNISVLDLDDCLYHECGTYDYDNEGAYHNETFVGLIRNVLNLHDRSTLEKLHLKVEFDLHYSKDMGLFDDPDFEDYVEREKGTAEQIEKLISYGISRNVKVLDIDLRGCSSYVDQSLTYNVPDVFRSNYLTELRLVACDVRSWWNICLESLKVLLLDEVSLNDVIMENILLGCPSLEDLSLLNCNGLGNLICKNPNLKKIMLTLDIELNKLKISCPFVFMLDIAGWIERADLVDVSSVVDASIFFSKNFKCEQKTYSEVDLLLKFLQCKTFSPCTWSILVFTIWNLKNVPCPNFRWKNLILKLRLTKWHHPGISFLLRSSQSLETLTMFIYPSWTDIFTNAEAQWIEDHDFDGENYWDSQEASFPHLKSIMIYGYINEPYVIQMVKFFLRSAGRLEKMVISTKESFKPTHQSYIFTCAIERQKYQYTSGQLLELSNKLLTLPRASSKAVIYFS